MSTPLRERPDAPLGTLIFRAGLLPAETIESALEEGVKTGRRLGEILIERGLLQEEDLTRLLAGQKGLPFVSLRSEPIDPEAARLLSEDQARLFSALPIRFEEGLPLVAVADPTNDVLNRNIGEALGRDVRFVVAGRTELGEVIGETYSGTLRAAPPEPVDEPEVPARETPLRVDTSIAPAPEEPSVPDYEPVSAVDAEPEAEPRLAATFEAPGQAPAFEAPEPALEAPEPVPAFEAPAYEPPSSEPDPEPVAPEPVATEPEPVFLPEPDFAAPPTAEQLEPPAPSFDAPAAPLATEPAATQVLPETNGHVPHDLEHDLLASAAEATAEEPAIPIEEPTLAPALPEPAPAANGAGFMVSIRLTGGERLTVAECGDIGEAKGYARALTKQLGTSDPDDWPFVNGRFLKPDTILSVDVEES